MVVIDISEFNDGDPLTNTPTKVGQITGSDNYLDDPRGIAVSGDYAYVASSGGSGAMAVFELNYLPVASALSLTPASPVTGDSLAGSYTYTDADGDSQSGSVIKWYKGAGAGVYVSGYDQTINIGASGATTNITDLPSSATLKGEQWHFKVTPNDGTDAGATALSNTVTINTSPVTAPSITTVAPKTGDALTGTPGYTDVDTDPQGPLTEIRWYKDNVLQDTYNETLAVPGSVTKKGEVWKFSVKPHDGKEFGTLVMSTDVTIVNAPPVATSPNITPSPAMTEDTLTANITFSDADTGDTDQDPAARIIWYKDGEATGAGRLTVDSSETESGEMWKFTYTPYDGEHEGTLVTSPEVQIDYIAPPPVTPDPESSSPSTEEEEIIEEEEAIDDEAIVPQEELFISEFDTTVISLAERIIIEEIIGFDFIRVVGANALVRLIGADNEGPISPEGLLLPIVNFRLRQAMYMFDGQGVLVTGQTEIEISEADPLGGETGVQIDFTEDWVNPVLVYWDAEAGELVTVDDVTYLYNQLSADFKDLSGMSLAIIDDISTQVSGIIYDVLGGTVENAEGITLDIPADSINEDIEVSITEVTITGGILNELARKQGMFIIDGKIYNFRATRISDGTRVGTPDDPFDEPVTIILEVAEGAENPVISWFNFETGLWEEMLTIRVDATHVSVEVDHFSKWAVFDIDELSEEDPILEATTEEEVDIQEIPAEEETPVAGEGSQEDTGETSLSWWQRVTRFFRNLFS